MKTPSEVYKKSDIKFEASELEIEYPSFFRTRKINRHGYLKLDMALIYLSTALAGFTVGITDLDESFFTVYFDYIKLGLIDRETYAFKPFGQKDIPLKKGG